MSGSDLICRQTGSPRRCISTDAPSTGCTTRMASGQLGHQYRLTSRRGVPCLRLKAPRFLCFDMLTLMAALLFTLGSSEACQGPRERDFGRAVPEHRIGQAQVRFGFLRRPDLRLGLDQRVRPAGCLFLFLFCFIWEPGIRRCISTVPPPGGRGGSWGISTG